MPGAWHTVTTHEPPGEKLVEQRRGAHRHGVSITQPCLRQTGGLDEALRAHTCTPIHSFLQELFPEYVFCAEPGADSDKQDRHSLGPHGHRASHPTGACVRGAKPRRKGEEEQGRVLTIPQLPAARWGHVECGSRRCPVFHGPAHPNVPTLSSEASRACGLSRLLSPAVVVTLTQPQRTCA